MIPFLNSALIALTASLVATAVGAFVGLAAYLTNDESLNRHVRGGQEPILRFAASALSAFQTALHVLLLLNFFLPTYLLAGAWTSHLVGTSWSPFSPTFAASSYVRSIASVTWIYATSLVPLSYLLTQLSILNTNRESWTLASLEGGLASLFRNGIWPSLRSWLAVVFVIQAGLVATDMLVTNLYQLDTLSERAYQRLMLGGHPTTEIFFGLIQAVAVVAVLCVLTRHASRLPTTTSPVESFDSMMSPQRFEPERTRNRSYFFAGLPIAQQQNLQQNLQQHLSTKPLLSVAACVWLQLASIFIAVLISVVPLVNLIGKAGWSGDRWTASQTLLSILAAPMRYSDEFYWSAILSFWASIFAVALSMLLLQISQLLKFSVKAFFATVIVSGLFLPGPAINAIINMTSQSMIEFFDHPAVERLFDSTLIAPIVALQFRLLPIALLMQLWIVDSFRTRFHSTLSLDRGLGWQAYWKTIGRKRFVGILWITVMLACYTFAELPCYILCLPPAVTTISLRVFELLHYGVRYQEAGLLLFLILICLPLAIAVGNRRST